MNDFLRILRVFVSCRLKNNAPPKLFLASITSVQNLHTISIFVVYKS